MSRICFISGTSRGIGLNLAKHFIEYGFKVIGCSRNGISAIEHPNYLHLKSDISKEADCKEIISEIKKRYGRLDYLINNAGVASMNHFILTPSKSLIKVFETNLFGTFLLSREGIKLMMKNNFGRVINFSTVAVPLYLSGESIYASSKAAVEQLTRNIAKEVAPYGITVNCIAPSPTPTDLIVAIPKEKIEELLNSQAIKRLSKMDDIINVVDFFISDKSDYITGQILYLGGVF